MDHKSNDLKTSLLWWQVCIAEINECTPKVEPLTNGIHAAQTLAQEQANKPKTTPLLEHLRAQKAAKSAKSAKKKAAAKTTLLKKKAAAAADGQQQPADKAKTGGPDEKKSSRPNRRKKDKSKSSTGEPTKSKEGGASPSTSSPQGGDPSSPKKQAKQPSSGEKKDTTGSKPKRSRNRDKKTKPDNKTGGDSDNKPPAIKILGRQQGTSGTTKATWRNHQMKDSFYPIGLWNIPLPSLSLIPPSSRDPSLLPSLPLPFHLLLIISNSFSFIGWWFAHCSWVPFDTPSADCEWLVY